ncbi:cytochrome P450 [Hymenobacter sp. B81]|uniref:cytochrome P450 n=1 Tax=Hymenobacter sp. B81 TaxID=3344878 RepID=UPI0037DCFAA5
MISQLPRTLVARYASTALKRLLRRTWRRVQRLRGRAAAPRLLFAFGGRTQYAPGTGRELYAHEAAFRATIDACERITQQELGGPSILGHFTGPPDPDFFASEVRLMHTSLVMQLALVDLWRALGAQPTAVLGVSLGEVAAVYAAGGLSLTDALRVGLCYCVISQVTQPDYTLLVVNGSFEQVGPLASKCPVELFVVLITNADSCLTFCPKVSVAEAQQHLMAHGITSAAPATQLIWPYHSPVLARHLPALRQPLQGLQPQPLALPCYLSTTGRQLAAGTILGPEYWLALIQYPVNVAGALGAALADGYQLINPIGADPFPFLFEPAQRAVLQTVQLLPGLRATEPERTTIANSRQRLAERGLVSPVPQPAPALGPPEFIARFSLGALEAQADPYPAYAHLRQWGGLQFLPAEQGWLILDTDLINKVLREPLVFSSTFNSDFDNELIGADPPTHTTNRLLMQPFFAPKELAALRGFTEATLAELVDDLHTRPLFDFVTDLAIPLTQRVSGQLMGLTAPELRQLQSCMPGHAYQLNYMAELTGFFTDYLQQREPTDQPTMMNHLLTLIQAGELSQAAALSLLKTMWLAGIATSSMLMSNATHYLLKHPLVAEQLRANPALIDNFIEEILRLEPPLSAFWRISTQAVTLGGHELPAGARVMCSIVAANRDPARYTQPDELDLSRRPTRHLSFGGGIHACIGAHLARLEARILVQWVLAQGSSLRPINPSAVPTYFPTPIFRALSSLPVTLQPVA